MYQNRNQNQLEFRVRGVTDVQRELESRSCILLQRERWFCSKLWKIDVYSDFQVKLLEISYFTYFIMLIPHI